MKIPNLRRFNTFSKSEPELEDPGFGTRITNSAARLINKDGSYNIEREGKQVWTAYQSMLEMRWRYFFAHVVLYYLTINFLFALLFVAVGVEHLAGVTPAGFWDNLAEAFFFSVQTFTTVGYGAVNPLGVAANLIASIDALVGLISTALATGLFFARFSRAQSQLIFSKDALITPYRNTEQMSFQFRIANLRGSKIFNLHASVILSWVVEENGFATRKFFNLPLERNHVNLLPLNWTIVHVIKPDSPILGWEPQDFTKKQAEIIVFLEGFDESFGQKIHVSSSYTCREIRWKARFLPMYYSTRGQTVLNLDTIHDFKFIQEEEEE